MKINIPYPPIAFFIWLVLFSSASYSQHYDSLMDKYSNEYGVVANYSEHLVLEFNKAGKLTATSSTSKDVLIVNDNYRTFFNTGSIYHSYFNELVSIEGSTLVPAKKGYTTIKSKQQRTIAAPGESVFYDDAKETEITFTNLVKGAITHLESTIDYRDIKILPRFYFKNYLPVAHAEFKVTYPKTVHIAAVIKGTEDAGFIKKITEETRKTITVTWSADDIPKAKVYNDAPSLNYYLPHIIVYIRNYIDPETNKEVPVFGTIEDLNRFCNDFVKGLKTSDSKAIADASGTITKDATTDQEKARRIYEWVQKNIKYVAYEDSLGGFIPREPEEVLRRRFGDCKDIATLLRALSRAAGMEAHYVWIGTRKLPYRYEDTPLPAVFNHMIAAVKLNSKWVFMDGTDPTVPFGIIPYPIQGKEGLIGKGENDFEVVIMPGSTAPSNQVTDSSYVSIDQGTLTGSIAIHLKGFPAWDMAALLMYQSEREQKDAFNAITQRGSNKYQQKAFDYKIDPDENKNLQIHAGFEIKDYVRKAGAEYFVNMNLIRSYADAWIDINDRSVPLENNYPEMMNQVVMLDIPKGYKATYVPESKEMKIPGIGSYNISYAIKEGKIILVKNLRMDSELITAAQFNDYNKLMAGIRNNYKESIVLSPL